MSVKDTDIVTLVHKTDVRLAIRMSSRSTFLAMQRAA